MPATAALVRCSRITRTALTLRTAGGGRLLQIATPVSSQNSSIPAPMAPETLGIPAVAFAIQRFSSEVWNGLRPRVT